ncbi:hypothetical protein OAG71_01700, partial [bacterium]|nr:hypothetical protein [bacterium]
MILQNDSIGPSRLATFVINCSDSSLSNSDGNVRESNMIRRFLFRSQFAQNPTRHTAANYQWDDVDCF